VREGFLTCLPAELFIELDLGWVWWAGADPVELLRTLPGRVPLVHVKDLAVRGGLVFHAVGEGEVGYARVLPAAISAGVEWLLVEQDEADEPPLEAARRSLAAVRAASSVGVTVERVERLVERRRPE
jgi:sugar phosphate isomerase/epimerase